MLSTFNFHSVKEQKRAHINLARKQSFTTLILFVLVAGTCFSSVYWLKETSIGWIHFGLQCI